MKNQKKKKQRNPKDLPTCAAAGRWEEGRGTRRGSGGVSPQPSGDAGRGAARSGRGACALGLEPAAVRGVRKLSS